MAATAFRVAVVSSLVLSCVLGAAPASASDYDRGFSEAPTAFFQNRLKELQTATLQGTWCLVFVEWDGPNPLNLNTRLTVKVNGIVQDSIDYDSLISNPTIGMRGCAGEGSQCVDNGCPYGDCRLTDEGPEGTDCRCLLATNFAFTVQATPGDVISCELSPLGQAEPELYTANDAVIAQIIFPPAVPSATVHVMGILVISLVTIAVSILLRRTLWRG
jgi:hypothetical protein